MEKNSEQRLAITFCYKAGKNATETFEMLKVAYGARLLCFVGRARFRRVG